jgi:hypothetical protein
MKIGSESEVPRLKIACKQRLRRQLQKWLELLLTGPTEGAYDVLTEMTVLFVKCEYLNRFDYVLINDEVEMAFDELVYLLQGWYPEIENYSATILPPPSTAQSNTSPMPTVSQPQSPTKTR